MFKLGDGRLRTHVYLHSLPNPTKMIINVFLRHKAKRRKKKGKETTETNSGNWEADGISDLKELRKGNPMLTVGKQKNNSIFSAGSLKSS